MTAYRKYVSAYARLFRAGQTLPLGNVPPRKNSTPKANAPLALICSPHPDDECIVGGLALRLRREAGFRVVNLAVTLGSNPVRRAARWRELSAACDLLGFKLETLSTPHGLEKINLKTRTKAPKVWAAAVRATAAALWRDRPAVIFLPHAQDWHPTHIGTHWLVMDAMATLPASFNCMLVETEFWGQMTSPNLLVESSTADVANLVAALSLHVGEVKRNPYHLRLPAWMMENVRRGAELVGGSGSKAPNLMFATLYRLRLWKNRSLKEIKPGRQISSRDDVSKW